MSDLEKRLRELVDAYMHSGEWPDLHTLCRTAARIGAEAEREACAAEIIAYRDNPEDMAMVVSYDYWDGITVAAGVVRARGGK